MGIHRKLNIPSIENKTLVYMYARMEKARRILFGMAGMVHSGICEAAEEWPACSMVMTERYIIERRESTFDVELCLQRRETSHDLRHFGGFCSFSVPQGTWIHIREEISECKAKIRKYDRYSAETEKITPRSESLRMRMRWRSSTGMVRKVP